ncbi:MAG: flagellar basal body P-ring protein FlgI [Pseudomonadota bacterium]
MKIILAGISIILCSTSVMAERIKDLATVAGVRNNQLIGYGLVVGLDGTGDQTSQTPFTVQSIKAMLAQFGVTVPPDVNPQLKNVAAVSLHADLPPFAKVGQTIDVTVSSIGNSKSLRGGSLLMSPLRGADGQVYALAQGNVVVSGFGVQGDGSKITVNVPSAGRVLNGATVERTVPTELGTADHIILNLRVADFSLAQNLVEAVNKKFGEGTAIPVDSVTIQIAAPRDIGQRVSYIALLEELEIKPVDASAKVIINSRTGTVVIGKGVRVSPAAVAHGNLIVTVKNQPLVSQPPPFSGGNTVGAVNSAVTAVEEQKRMFVFNPGVSLDEIVQAINDVGAAPGDLVAILEALKEAGALRAELIVI